MPVVVMGVSGVGKSTVARLLASRLDVPFCDADDLHPAANVELMRAGVPLKDEHRWPWLDEVGAWLAANPDGVTACSALRRRYRDRLRLHAPGTVHVHLLAEDETLAARQADRRGHFMPTSLLPSQQQALEPLEADEAGVEVATDRPPEDVVDAIVVELGSTD